MPAASKTPPKDGHRPGDPDPFNVDMTEVPMTPAMTALHDAAKLRARILKIDRFLENIVLDGTELTLAEGQTLTFAMRAQGRGFKWRAQLNRIMRRRDIDVSRWNWRYRTRDLEPEEVPPYMSPEVLAAMREIIEPLAAMVDDPTEQREQLYPAIHERTKAAIEGPAEAEAS